MSDSGNILLLRWFRQDVSKLIVRAHLVNYKVLSCYPVLNPQVSRGDVSRVLVMSSSGEHAFCGTGVRLDVYGGLSAL